MLSCVKESTPISVSADASSNHGAAPAVATVFESKPQESKERMGCTCDSVLWE